MADLDEVKKILKSLLTSTPLKMTVKQLDNDFKETEGRPIPYYQFGFESLEELIHSIPDTIQVLGTGLYAEVRPVISNNALSSEISRLVCMQKKPTKGHSRLHRRKQIRQPHIKPSQYFPTYQSPVIHNVPNFKSPRRDYNNVAYQTPNNKVNMAYTEKMANQIKSPSVVTKSTVIKPEVVPNYSKENYEFNNVPNRTPPPASHTYSLKQEHIRDVGDKCKYSKEETQFSPNYVERKNASEEILIDPRKSSATISKYHKQTNIDHRNDAEYIDNRYYSDDDFNTYEDDIVYKVPYQVQENIEKILNEYPEGIWCAKLHETYKKTYGFELNYLSYGYKCLAQMCSELSRICQCIQPNKGDYKIYSKHTVIPKSNIHSTKKSMSVKKAECPQAEALPYVDDLLDILLQDSYPPDTVKMFEILERQWIPENLKTLELIDITVSEVYDPSKFWITLLSTDCYFKLNDMMDDMQNFYQEHASSFWIRNAKLLRVGLYCAAIYNGEYHRAIIVKIQEDSSFVKVFYIDYGTIQSISINDVWFLHRKYFNLPAQAIRARLAGILPPKMHTPWSERSCELFYAMVVSKQLIAQIANINNEKKTLELLLCDTNTDEDIFINDCLVKEGVAILTSQEQEIFTPQCVPIVKYIHIYPTFEEIEQALVPSSTDMVIFKNRKIEHSLLLPQYYNNNVYQKLKVKANDIEQDKDLEQQNHEVSIEDLVHDLEDNINLSNSTVESNRSSFDHNSSSSCSNTPCENIDKISLSSSTTGEILITPSPVQTQTVVPSQTFLRPPPGFHALPVAKTLTENSNVIPQNPYYNNCYGNLELNLNQYYQKQEIYNKCLEFYNSIVKPQYSNPVLPQSVNQIPLQNMMYNNVYPSIPVPNLNSVQPMPYVNGVYPLSYNTSFQQNIPNYQQFYLPGNPLQMAQFPHHHNVIMSNVSNPPQSYIPCTSNQCISTATNIPYPTINDSYETCSTTDGYQSTCSDFSTRTTESDRNIKSPIDSSSSSDNTITEHYNKSGPTKNESPTTVIQEEFCKTYVHVIYLDGETYFMVNEIINKVAKVATTIVQIRRLIAIGNGSVKILDVNLKEKMDLKEQLLRWRSIEEDVDFIHIIPVKTVPIFLNILTKCSIPLTEYNEFLEKIKRRLNISGSTESL